RQGNEDLFAFRIQREAIRSDGGDIAREGNGGALRQIGGFHIGLGERLRGGQRVGRPHVGEADGGAVYSGLTVYREEGSIDGNDIAGLERQQRGSCQPNPHGDALVILHIEIVGEGVGSQQDGQVLQAHRRAV